MGRRVQLPFGLLLIFGLLHMYKCDEANFLGVRQRFNDSSLYDYYYCCNICDGVLRWIVNDAIVIQHLTSQTEVGNVETVESGVNSNSLLYTSLILSKRPNGEHMCLDAVLVFTQDSPDLMPVVKCQSNLGTYTVQNRTVPETIFDVNNPSVTIRNTENSHRDVVSPGNNSSTQIVVCRTSGNFLRWSNDTSSALFNGISRAGSNQFKLHPLDNNTALWNTVVLERTDAYIASAIIWTDYISAGSYHVNCGSGTHEVTTMVNTPPISVQTPSVPVSTVASDSRPPVTPVSTSSETAVSRSSVISVSTSLVSGYEPLKYYVTSVVVALLIAIWFSTT